MIAARMRKPDAVELYLASLAATAIVYVAGIAFLAVMSYFAANGGGWQQVAQTVFVVGVIGLLFAAGAAFMIVAPLGAAFGLMVLKISPPGWWQGPLTGALVAIALEAFVLLFVSREPLEWEWGNAVTLLLPIVLAMMAGAYVQRRILHWPERLPAR